MTKKGTCPLKHSKNLAFNKLKISDACLHIITELEGIYRHVPNSKEFINGPNKLALHNSRPERLAADKTLAYWTH